MQPLGRVLGDWPTLAPAARFEGRDLAVTTDFRDLFSEVLVRHLGATNLGAVFSGFQSDASRWTGVMDRQRGRNSSHQPPNATFGDPCANAARFQPSVRFPLMNLDRARCVVTGATEGIGRALALALGARGARVAVCARTADRVNDLVGHLESAGVTAMGGSCDVSDQRGVSSFAERVLSELGTPDVLVNNAGMGHFGPLAELTVERFDETMGTNVRGIFLMTKAFLPSMLEAGKGHIVNIASLAGRTGFVGGTATRPPSTPCWAFPGP